MPPNFLGFRYYIGKDAANTKSIFVKFDGTLGQAAERESHLLRLLRAKTNHSYFPNLLTSKSGGLYSFVAMDFIHGITLERFLAKKVPNIHQVRQIVVQLLDILTILHSCRVVHRDVRPNNIMIRISKTKKIHVTLIDFSYAVGHKPNSLPELPFLKNKKNILSMLGGKRYKPESLKWDDAYSICQIIRSIDPRCHLNFPVEWRRLRASIGKVTYTHRP